MKDGIAGVMPSFFVMCFSECDCLAIKVLKLCENCVDFDTGSGCRI